MGLPPPPPPGGGSGGGEVGSGRGLHCSEAKYGQEINCGVPDSVDMCGGRADEGVLGFERMMGKGGDQIIGDTGNSGSGYGGYG